MTSRYKAKYVATRQVVVWMPKFMYDRLSIVAKAKGINMSELIREAGYRMITLYYEDSVKELANAPKPGYNNLDDNKEANK